MASRFISREKAAGIALIALLISLVPCTPGHTDFTLPGNILFSRSDYDYGPSVIQDGNVQKFWWCGAGTVPNTSFYTDVIYYRSYNFSTGQWTPITKVLWPTSGTWDGYFTCDPSVVQGSFVNPQNGQTYAYAMYYTATDDGTGVNNRIGLAYSNNGTTWVKYSAPVVYPQSFPTASYGAGQAASYNGNGAAGIWLFHTDTSTANGTRIWVRTTNDGIHFGAPSLVSSNGAPVNANSDFAYDYNTGYWYGSIGQPGRPGDRETYHFGFYRIPASQLTTGTWELLGNVNTNLTGYYLNHSSGLLRDKYGNLTPWLPVVEAYFAVGGNDPSTWDLSWAMWRPTPATLPFKRYYSGSLSDHWETTGYIAPGYNVESTLGYMYMSNVAGTIPMYGCQIGNDHFISPDPNCEGQRANGENGYLYPTSQPGTVPLYRCVVAGTGDHFTSTASNCEGQIVESLLGYAKSSP